MATLTADPVPPVRTDTRISGVASIAFHCMSGVKISDFTIGEAPGCDVAVAARRRSEATFIGSIRHGYEVRQKLPRAGLPTIGPGSGDTCGGIAAGQRSRNRGGEIRV